MCYNIFKTKKGTILIMELKNDFFQSNLKIAYPKDMVLHYNICHATELLQKYQMTDDKQLLKDANYNIKKSLEALNIPLDETKASETDTNLERQAKEIYNQVMHFVKLATEKQQNS